MNREDIGRIARLASAPVAVFWRECFLRSAYTRQKSMREMCELGTRADECGRMYGRRIRAEGKSVCELCADNGLEIREFTLPESPSAEIFALFEPPASIYVRTTLLSECDRFIRDNGLDAALGQFCCMDIVLCHEFFHFLEVRDRKTIFTRTYREPFGRFGRKTELPPLGEIAAMGFAQEMLGLKWSPFLLDCIFLSAGDTASALAILERLEQFVVEYAEEPFA